MDTAESNQATTNTVRFLIIEPRYGCAASRGAQCLPRFGATKHKRDNATLFPVAFCGFDQAEGIRFAGRSRQNLFWLQRARFSPADGLQGNCRVIRLRSRATAGFQREIPRWSEPLWACSNSRCRPAGPAARRISPHESQTVLRQLARLLRHGSQRRPFDGTTHMFAQRTKGRRAARSWQPIGRGC